MSYSRILVALLVASPGCFSDPGPMQGHSGETSGEGDSSDTGDTDADTSTGSDTSTDGTGTDESESGPPPVDMGSSDETGDPDECTWLRFGENLDDEVQAVTADTWIDEEFPTMNNGADDDLRADGESDAGMTEVAFIRFDVSSMPEGEVVDAILHLSTNDDDGSESSPGSQFSLYTVEEPWAEGEANWLEASAGMAWSVPGCAGDPCRGALELAFFEPTEQSHSYALAFDPTIAQAWRDDPELNYGLLLATPASNGGSFHSSEGKSNTMRPALEVLVCP